MTMKLRSIWMRLAVMAAALLVPAAGAQAQGTSGTFASPINSQQLEAYAEVLGLSDAQRLAMQAEHDAYRAAFRALREGEIAAFLQRQQGAQGGIPRRELVEELLGELGDIERQIGEVDGQLFDRLLPLLTEDQRRLVPRVRMERERSRYAVRLVQVNLGRAIADLSVLMRGIELEPDAALAADATLATYERRLTTMMRKQNEAMNRMTLDMMDILVERGFEDISQEKLLADPELLQKVVKEITAVYADLQAEVAELGTDIRVLNRRTFRQLASSMPKAAGRQLRDAFYERSHPELAGLVALSRADWLSRAAELEELEPGERDVVAPSAQRYTQVLDRVLDASFERVDSYWQGFSPFAVDVEAAEAMQRDLRAWREEAEGARDEVEASVAAALGDQAVARLREAAAQPDAAAAPRRPMRVMTDSFMPDRRSGVAGDAFLPPALAVEDLDLLARRLELDADTRTVLSVLHEDYRAAIDAAPVFRDLGEARIEQSRAVSDPEADEETAIARVESLRRSALLELQRIDAEFFEGVRGLWDDERPLLERAARMRGRAAYAGSGGAGLYLGRDVAQEARVDLLAVLLDAGLEPARLDALASILDEYEREAIDVLRVRYDARLALQRVTDAWPAALTRAGREDMSAIIEMQTRFREVVREPSARLEAAEEAVGALNRRTLGRVIAELPPDEAHRVQREYDRVAFPSIVHDDAAMGDAIAAALALPDLTPPQREDLMQLASEYRPDYERVTRFMIDAVGSAGLNIVGVETEAFADWQRHQQEVTRLRFDRNELNARAIARVHAILTEVQIAAIGGLPEPLGEDEFFLFR